MIGESLSPTPRQRTEAKFRLRLPALINGAFFAGTEERVVPAFYLTAIVVVMINLWMLARAGWDL